MDTNQLLTKINLFMMVKLEIVQVKHLGVLVAMVIFDEQFNEVVIAVS